MNLLFSSDATGSLISIMDINGSVILNNIMVDGNLIDLDISNFASGIYLIAVKSESGISYARFVKD